MLDRLLRTVKRFIPTKLFVALQPLYHYMLAFAGALIYRFPSKDIFLIGVTGTKGKTSTIELANAILEEAGFKTALASTLRIKVGQDSNRNMFKMTMPGRFFIQRFLRKAVNGGCQYVLLEMTSEGVKLFRHKFIDLNALIFTNLSPEHIEAHGSYENYIAAKLKIAKALERSKKGNKVLIVNKDDREAEKFLAIKVPQKFTYTLGENRLFALRQEGVELVVDKMRIQTKLVGKFNAYNALAAATLAKTQSIDINTIKSALEKFTGIGGRMENVNVGQNFSVIVDYAHTPDSLEKVYEVFADRRKICVLGGTGGGRDKWKRKTMGAIADKHCSHIILTDEDPYDEDPRQIIGNIAEGIENTEYRVSLDRRDAMYSAFKIARSGDVVIITGKGTDPYIMGSGGTKTSWDDASVAREELKKLLRK